MSGVFQPGVFQPGVFQMGGGLMPYIPVIPSNLQSDRQDLRNAIMALLGAVQTAKPGIINQAWRARPAGVGEFPLAYISDINESSIHDGGTRTSTFTGSIVYVDTLSNATETKARVDIFLDYIRDLLTANYDIVAQEVPSAGKFEQIGVTDVEESWGTNVETAATAILWRIVMQRGRD
jgi:hypothetical protein